MGLVYVYGPNDNENDYSTMGLCGPLDATKCEFISEANGESSVEMEHPIDQLGKFDYLENGNILKVRIPVRRAPAIQNGSDQLLTRVWKYRLKSKAEIGSRKALYTLYKKKTGTAGKKLKFDTTVVSLSYISDGDTDKSKRYEVITEDGGKGWMLMEGLIPIDGPEGTVLDGNSSASIETILSPWAVTDDLFRIYEVQKTLDGVSVKARHITYDLMYNITGYYAEHEVTVQDDITGILGNCYAEHSFEAYTDVQNKREGISYRGKNPMNAFIDETDGVCARFAVDMVRIDHSLYFLHDPGVNRGVRIEYARNMTGIDFTYSMDQISTRFIPVGKTKDGKPFYLDNKEGADNTKIIKTADKISKTTGKKIGNTYWIGEDESNYELYQIGPEFEPNTYYSRKTQSGQYVYTVLTEKPSDWDAKYSTKYYEKGTDSQGSVAYALVSTVLTKINRYIDSPKIGNYAFPYVYEFTVDDCEIDKKGSDGVKVTADIARLRMRRAVEDLLKDGTIDQPKVELKVEFQNLGETEEYKNTEFKDLETCYLYDYVTVMYRKMGINQVLQIIKMEWDCLTEHMVSMDMGTPNKYINGVNVGNKADQGVASGYKEPEKSATLGGLVYVSSELPEITPGLDPNTIIYDPINMTLSTPDIETGLWKTNYLSSGGLASKGIDSYVGVSTSEISPVGFTLESSALNEDYLGKGSPNNGDIFYNAADGFKTQRYEEETRQWVSTELRKMDIAMSGRNEPFLQVGEYPGIKVIQDMGTYFQANSTRFGLYEQNTGTAIAVGGVDNGVGYFQSNRMRMDIPMTESSSMKVDKDNGVKVEQDAGSYFAADATRFGLYDRATHEPIAEGGILNGVGYFASNYMRMDIPMSLVSRMKVDKDNGVKVEQDGGSYFVADATRFGLYKKRGDTPIAEGGIDAFGNGYFSSSYMRMDIPMSSSSSMKVDRNNGVKVEQNAGTYFQANALKFGLYNKASNEPIAEGGIDADGTGYFSANRLKDPTRDTGHVDINAESSDERLGYSVNFKTLDYDGVPFQPGNYSPAPRTQKMSALQIRVSNEPAYPGGLTWENNVSASIDVSNNGMLEMGRIRISSAESPLSPESCPIEYGEAWGYFTGDAMGIVLQSTNWIKQTNTEYIQDYLLPGKFYDEWLDAPIVVSPHPDSITVYTSSGVRAVSNGNTEDTGYIRFIASSAITVDLKVNVLVLGLKPRNDWED